MDFLVSNYNETNISELETYIKVACRTINKSLDKINDSTNEGNNVNIKKSASTIIDCNNNNNNNVGNNSSVTTGISHPEFSCRKEETKYWEELVRKLSQPAYPGSPTPHVKKKKKIKKFGIAKNKQDKFDKNANEYLQKQRRIINRLIRPRNYQQTSPSNLRNKNKKKTLK